MTLNIAELRRLEAAATAGPWVVSRHKELAVRSDEDDQTYGMAIPFADFFGEQADSNLALIVAMRNALPELLRKAEAFDQIVAQGGEAHGGNVAISQSFAKRQSRPISGAFDRKHPLPPHGGVDVG